MLHLFPLYLSHNFHNMHFPFLITGIQNYTMKINNCDGGLTFTTRTGNHSNIPLSKEEREAEEYMEISG